MRILINTAHQRFGGAIQVALSFIYECQKFSQHDFHIWVGPGVAKSIQTEDFPCNFTFSFYDFGIITLKKISLINRTLQTEEKKIKPDVIIATSGPSYFHSQAPQIIGFNLPLYIYPESPYLQSWTIKRKIRMGLKKLAHYYFFHRDATAYVVQTDDVNKRVRQTLGTQKVHTVTNTHNHYYVNWKPFPPKLPPKQAGAFRFVTISSWYPHKNLELIPEVQQVLQSREISNVEFVLTLQKEDYQEKVIKGRKNVGIHNIGPIRPEECPSLYQECDALFLPTLAECFSASYPEAMKMGKPIITTDLGFARSICGQSALYFKPKDAVDAADKIEQLLNTPGLQTQLIQSGREQLKNFDTATERAKKYLELCELYGNK